jgi:hypothetical protein
MQACFYFIFYLKKTNVTWGKKSLICGQTLKRKKEGEHQKNAQLKKLYRRQMKKKKT